MRSSLSDARTLSGSLNQYSSNSCEISKSTRELNQTASGTTPSGGAEKAVQLLDFEILIWMVRTPSIQ